MYAWCKHISDHNQSIATAFVAETACCLQHWVATASNVSTVTNSHFSANDSVIKFCIHVSKGIFDYCAGSRVGGAVEPSGMLA